LTVVKETDVKVEWGFGGRGFLADEKVTVVRIGVEPTVDQ